MKRIGEYLIAPAALLGVLLAIKVLLWILGADPNLVGQP